MLLCFGLHAVAWTDRLFCDWRGILVRSGHTIRGCLEEVLFWSFSYLYALSCTLVRCRVPGMDSTRTGWCFIFFFFTLPGCRVVPFLRLALTWWRLRGVSLGRLINPTRTSVFKHIGGLLIARGLGLGAVSRP